MGKKGSSTVSWLRSAVKKAFSAAASSSKDSTGNSSDQLHPHQTQLSDPNLQLQDEPLRQCRDSNFKYLSSLKDAGTAPSKENIIANIHERRKSFKENNRWSFRQSSKALQAAADQPHLLHPSSGTLDHPPGNTGDDFNVHFEKSYIGHSDHQNKHALAVAVATAAAAEAAAAAAKAAAQVAKLAGRSGPGGFATPRSSNFGCRQSREELAAIKIQAAFRGYLARRTLRTLKGLARLQALTQGRVGQRQTTATMRCMQALVRAQAAVRGRRTTRLCEETDQLGKSAVHPCTWGRRRNAVVTGAPDMVQKGDPDVGDQRVRQELPDWDDSTQTIEEIQARDLLKHEAAVKRERAMAYAFSHQQLNSGNKYPNATPDQFGWNWLERWMATRPWDNRRQSPAKETAKSRQSSTSGSAPATAVQRHPSPLKRGSAPATPLRQPLSRPSMTPRTASPVRTPTAGVTPISSSFSAPAAPRVSNIPVSASCSRAHSLASSSLRDDLSVASFSGTPSYMASTESARAKLRSHSTPKQRAPAIRSAATSVYSDDIHLQQPAATLRDARKRLSFSNATVSSSRNFMSWRANASLQRNLSFEGYTKTKFLP